MKAISHFVPLAIVCLLSTPVAFAQARSASVTAHSRSLSLAEYSGMHPDFGPLINYVTTFDGQTGIPLHEIIAGDFYNSEELLPVPGQPVPALYQADFATFSDDELVSYGEFAINLPVTDSDTNGLPDFLQFNKPGTVQFTGSGRPDFRSLGLPLNPFTIVNGQLTRSANSRSGHYIMTLVEPAPVGTVTYQGQFDLNLVTGTADYLRGDSNQISFDLLTGDMEGTVAAETSFTMVSQDEISLPQFTFRSDVGSITVRAFSLVRTGATYRGNMQFVDGDPTTSWPDYTEWLIEITDTNDFDRDGIPDLSDSELPGNLPPIVTLTEPLDNSLFVAPSVFPLLAKATDPDGEVINVEFFAGTEKVGESDIDPFFTFWHRAPAGSYSLTAKATDNLGAASTSAPITVVVRELGPDGLLYSTGFEPDQGYAVGNPLAGQGRWFGNVPLRFSGIMADAIPGQGQSAYIGLHRAVTNTAMAFYINQSINFEPLTAGTPALAFSAVVKIIPSSNGKADTFYVCFRGADGSPFFSLIFATNSPISYLAGGTRKVTTVSLPTNQFHLNVVMDMERNRWNALLDGLDIITNQPVRTYASQMWFGSIEVEWKPADRNNPGNNYMLFDDILLRASSSLPQKPTLAISPAQPGRIRIQLTGQPNKSYRLESTTDFVTWTQVAEVIQSGQDGVALFPEISVLGSTSAFYRCREIPTYLNSSGRVSTFRVNAENRSNARCSADR